MGFLAVIVAGAAGFVFGGIWYTVLAKAWVTASSVPLDDSGEPVNRKNPLPYITALVGTVLVAGMMRHIFVLSGIDTVGASLVAGLGTGLFLVMPWVITFYGFAARPRALVLIDGGYAIGGCMVIGLVLGLF